MRELDQYLDRLASADPTPGGGSAAAVAGGLGSALCAMVARITGKSERHAAVRDDAAAVAGDADALRDRFAAARTLDETAYERVVAATALPRASEAEKRERTATLQRALAGAAEAPLGAAGLAAEGLELAARAAALGNAHLMSDVECAIHFFEAALAASTANVRVNHRFIKDAAVVESQDERLTAIHAAAQDAAKRARAAVAAAAG